MVDAPGTNEPTGAPARATGGAASSDAHASGPSPLTKLLIEAGPLVVFFATNAVFTRGGESGIFVATGAFMAAMTLSLLASWRLERRLPPMPLITTVFVLVFGGLTLYLENDVFIKLKPTIVNLLFATILAAGLLLRRPFLKLAFESAFRLTEEGWRRLTVRWVLFFVFLAGLNELVWRNFSTDAWVSFKLLGILPLTLVFGATLVPLIRRHELPGAEGDTAEKPLDTPS